jgi:hypothetical protein
MRPETRSAVWTLILIVATLATLVMVGVATTQ